MPLIIHKHGVTREMTPEEEAEHLASLPSAEELAAENNAQRVAEIDSATQAHIIAVASYNHQRNLTARALELTDIKADGGSLTAEEEAELTAIKAVWAWVKLVLAEGQRLKDDTNLTVADANYPVFGG